METFGGLEVVLFASPDTWGNWLETHPTEPKGLWLKIAKRGSGVSSVSYAEALDVALCYGWIDGQKQSYDAQFFLQKFTPRRAKSVWSKVNVEKVAALVAAGRMKPSGLMAVEAAKQDGRWDQAYDSHRTSTVPDDFQDALDQNESAKAFFASLSKTNVYAFLWRIQTARTPETRQARIEKFITMLSEGKTFHP